MTLNGIIMLLFPDVIKWRNNQVKLKTSLLLFPFVCRSGEEIRNLQVMKKNNSQVIPPFSVRVVKLCLFMQVVQSEQLRGQSGVNGWS